MKVLASSVIRSTHRGDSHGGLYVVDTDKRTFEQVVDWDFEDIRWDLSLGGDRGLRGLIFHGDHLYAAGARHLFVFNRDFQLVDQHTHRYLDGTHELAIDGDHLYNIANCYDTIMAFNLKTKLWDFGFQHIKGRYIEKFDPDTDTIPPADTLHLDSVSVKDGWIYYAGSTTEHLYGYHYFSGTLKSIQLYHKNTHNAQFWRGGIVFNRSLESDTCFQIADGTKLVQHWPTPRVDRAKLTNAGLPADHARAEYTRGMVLGEDSICIGTSPACIHEFEVGRTEPISTVRLTLDVRNSICGMTRYE
jgi:hypothetical protein